MTNQRTRRTGAAAAVGLAVALLAGCGSNGSDTPSGGSGSDEKDIALVVGLANSPFFSDIACGAKSAAEKDGAVNLTVSAPNQIDATAQTTVVRSVLAKKPDALIVEPLDAKALYAPLKQADAQGVKVLTIDTNIDPSDPSSSFVASDNVASGKMAAKAMSEQVPDGGKVLILGGLNGAQSNTDRVTGFTEGLADYPNLEALPTQYEQQDATKAASIVQSTIAVNPDLAGVFVATGGPLDGVVSALLRTNKNDQVKTVAFDTLPAELTLLKAGKIQALIGQSPYIMGQKSVENAIKLLDGETVPTTEITDVAIVTQDNMDDPATKPYLYTNTC